ncbi:hypothetical protein V6N12_000069 [Hibiscus sabdariffa]|uniref:Uncharacterized protein n=1 Tax=Hibiscus sabdariffa TaxID=183260 RepID=A0ABR2BFS6_9ROSI
MCWASLAAAPPPSWDLLRLAQVVRPPDGLVAMARFPWRFVWIAPLGLAAASFATVGAPPFLRLMHPSFLAYAECRAGRCCGRLFFLFLKLSSYLARKPSACDLASLPTPHSGADCWLCVWHRPCGPALPMAAPWYGVYCLPRRLVTRLRAVVRCCTGCRPQFLARKAPTHFLFSLPVSRIGAAR